MEFTVVKSLVGRLRDRKATAAFMEVVELRQRLFQEHRDTILILDQYDLIADHILLFAGSDRKLIGYLRSISGRTCEKYGLPFPSEQLIGARPEYAFAYQRFKRQTKNPMHMGYLCFDPAYKDELRGMKAIDFLGWIAFVHADGPREELGLACTLNTRYKQDPSIRLIGDWIPNLPDFVHPTVSDLHRVVLIPKMYDDYWTKQRAKFAAVLQTLTDGERDLLLDDSDIAA